MIPSSVGMSPSSHASARSYRSDMSSVVSFFLESDENDVRTSSSNVNSGAETLICGFTCKCARTERQRIPNPTDNIRRHSKQNVSPSAFSYRSGPAPARKHPTCDWRSAKIQSTLRPLCEPFTIATMAATTGAPQPPPPPSGNLPSRPPALTDNGLDDLQRCSVCSRDRPNSEFKFGDSKILKTCTRCRANKGAQNRRVRAKATHAPALTDGGLVDSQICTNCGNTKPKADFQSVRGIGTKTCANCRALNAETARHSKAKKISKNKKAPARTDDDLADEPADELVDDPADDPDDDPDDDRVCNKCGKTKPKSDFRSAYGTHRLLKLCAKCRVVASGADRSGNGTPSATGPPPKKR